VIDGSWYLTWRGILWCCAARGRYSKGVFNDLDRSDRDQLLGGTVAAVRAGFSGRESEGGADAKWVE